MRLLIDAFPIAGGTIGLGGEVAWPLPARPGDLLHIEGEIIEIKPVTFEARPWRRHNPR
jgi:hypothetical protein